MAEIEKESIEVIRSGCLSSRVAKEALSFANNKVMKTLWQYTNLRRKKTVTTPPFFKSKVNKINSDGL